MAYAGQGAPAGETTLASSAVGGAGAAPQPVALPSVVPPPRRPASADPPGPARRRPAGGGTAAALAAGDGFACAFAAALGGAGWRSSALLGLTAVLLLSAQGLYRQRLSLSLLDDLPWLLAVAFVASSTAALAHAMAADDFPDALVVGAPSVALALLIVRSLTYTVVRTLRRRGRSQARALIVGGGVVANDLTTALLDHLEYGLSPVGFVDDEPFIPPADWPVPHLGGYGDISRIIRDYDVQTTIVAFGSSREGGMVDALRECDRLGCELYYVPRLYELSSVHRSMELVWGIPVVRLRRAAYRAASWRLKRALDVVLAGAGLVLALPVLVACALLVWLEVGAPVLFRQERVGLDGKSFTIFKFCTLRPTAGEGDTAWSIADDDRIGPVGRLLRRTSLDELPQLWNVLRGDMSLVGPRPERPFFAELYSENFPSYRARHRVPVGLTGWSQVHGLRGDTSILHRARFDNVYIENWSLWEDVKIMLQTLAQVALGRGR